MGARLPQKKNKAMRKPVVKESTEARSSLDECVLVQDTLTSRFIDLRLELEETELELEMATTLLEHITKRVNDRQHSIDSLNIQLNTNELIPIPENDEDDNIE